VDREAGQAGARTRRAGRATEHPRRHGGRDGAGGRARERSRGGTRGEQPDQRPAHPGERLQPDQHGEGGEPVPALQRAAQRVQYGQRCQREREQHHRDRVVHVQQPHQCRGRHQRPGADQRADREPGAQRLAHPVAAVTGRSGERRRSRFLAEPSTADAFLRERRRSRFLAEPSTPNAFLGTGHVQRHGGLRGEGRDQADQQHGQQRAEFAEGTGCQGPGREHGEDVAGRVAAEQGDRDQHRGESDASVPGRIDSDHRDTSACYLPVA
jgi:hypothetical protein